MQARFAVLWARYLQLPSFDAETTGTCAHSESPGTTGRSERILMAPREWSLVSNSLQSIGSIIDGDHVYNLRVCYREAMGSMRRYKGYGAWCRALAAHWLASGNEHNLRRFPADWAAKPAVLPAGTAR